MLSKKVNNALLFFVLERNTVIVGKEEINKETLGEDTKNGGKKKWFLILLLLLFLAGGGFYFILNRSGFEFDPNAAKYESKVKKPEEWAGDQLAFPGFNEITITDQMSDFQLALFNPDFNDAYFQYSLYFDEEKDPFFKTGIVKPGEAVTTVHLPNKLKAGEYKVKLDIKAFAPGAPDMRLNGAVSFLNLRVLEDSGEK